MKTFNALFYMLLVILVLNSCNENDPGSIVFKGVPNVVEVKSASFTVEKSKSNEDAYVMHTENMQVNVEEIWVSQEPVSDSARNDIKWYSIGQSDGLKFVEELELTGNNLPTGTYQSIKIAFRNKFVRHAVYADDLNRKVEMASSMTEGNCGDESIVEFYFSDGGSFYVEGNVFRLMSPKEYIHGFNIKPNETTFVYWMLGFPGLDYTDCTFLWHDINNNGIWDCGADLLNEFNCTIAGPMWSFSVDEGNGIEYTPMDWNRNEEPDNQERFNIDRTLTLSDIAGNSYRAVKIGDQVWMAQNLRTNQLNDSTPIVNIPDALNWQQNGVGLKVPAQCVYNNDGNSLANHGRYYNWYTVETGKLCPTGWHVPSKQDWETLIDYLQQYGDDAAMLMRMPNAGWSPEGSNESGFSAIPSGFRHQDGDYMYFQESGFWWSSTPHQIPNNPEIQAYYLNIRSGVSYYTNFEEEGEGIISAGMNVRCVKD